MLVNIVSYFLVLSLVEVHSQLCDNHTDGEASQPRCTSNYTNGYCKHPGECVCNAGYKKRNDTCVPVCQDECLHGTCDAPNTCRCDSGYNLVNDTCLKGQTSKISNEDTTTTTKDPFKTSQYNNYNNHTENTTIPTTTTPTPHFVSSSCTTERIATNNTNTTGISSYPTEKSWTQQNGMFIWIPIIVILTTGFVLLLVWRRTPMKIVNFFKGQSYDVQGAFLQRNGSSVFGRLEFIPDEWQSQS